MFRSEDVILVTRDGAPAGFFLAWDPSCQSKSAGSVPATVRADRGQASGRRCERASGARRSLPTAVVADANVLLSALIGGRAGLVIASPHDPRCIST
jgi:hypothetical protein